MYRFPDTSVIAYTGITIPELAAAEILPSGVTLRMR